MVALAGDWLRMVQIKRGGVEKRKEDTEDLWITQYGMLLKTLEVHLKLVILLKQ